MPIKKFRSRTNSAIAILVWTFVVLTFGANIANPKVGGTVMLALLFIAAIAWVLFWRPTLTIDDEGLWVQNPFSKTRCDFVDIQAVDGRFGLILLHHQKRITVWAVTGRDSATAREVFGLWKAAKK